MSVMKYTVYLLLHSLFVTSMCQNSTTDPASDQLENYARSHCQEIQIIQTAFGAPVSSIESSLSVGKNGTVLLQDTIALEVISSFSRRRIPQRVYSAKGAGAFGYFEVTNDITKYTKAVIFREKGKRTKIAARFSILGSEPATPDTTRAHHGFSVKFYTEEGIWDIITSTYDATFTRDPMAMMHYMHAFGRNPVTNLKDNNMMWDYITLNPNIMYMMLNFYGEAGLPESYRHMNTYGVHTFKMVNSNDEIFFIKFHCLTDQGVQNMTSDQARSLISSDSDYYIHDLYNNIALGDYPSWTLCIQVMTSKEARQYQYDPFDPTRPWPTNEFPLIEAGKIVLNKNPENYFADIEQMAFNPGNMIPGIELGPDKMLHGRMLIYPDAQRYRLGTNYHQLPVNRPFKHCVTNNQQKGHASYCNHAGAPIYYPNSFHGPKPDSDAAMSTYYVSGNVAKYNSSLDDTLDLATSFWDYQSESQKDEIVEAITEQMGNVADFLKRRAVRLFKRVANDLAVKVNKTLREKLSTEE